jgi:hypothetical protein
VLALFPPVPPPLFLDDNVALLVFIDGYIIGGSILLAKPLLRTISIELSLLVSSFCDMNDSFIFVDYDVVGPVDLFLTAIG